MCDCDLIRAEDLCKWNPVKRRLYWVGVDPIQRLVSLEEKGVGDRHRGAGEKCHVVTEAETRETCLQGDGCHGLWAVSEPGRAKRPPGALRGCLALRSLGFGIPASRAVSEDTSILSQSVSGLRLQEPRETHAG